MKNFNFLYFIPAKETSTRFPGKGLKKIAGLSLVQKAALVAAKSFLNSQRSEGIIFSSENPITLSHAEVINTYYRKELNISSNIITLHKRDSSQSQPTSRIEDLLKDFLLAPRYENVSHVILLNPTSPLRTLDTIQRSIDIILAGKYDSTTTVYKTHKPGLNWTQDGERWIPQNYKRRVRTQDIQPYYIEHGACYIAPRESIIEKGTLYGENPFPVETNFRESIDVDTPEDYLIAKAIGEYDHLSDFFSEQSIKKLIEGE